MLLHLSGLMCLLHLTLLITLHYHRYTLPEDIPAGHITLTNPGAMMPTTLPGAGGAAEPATVYDFFFDTATDK
jgi:hypothetical protein